MNEIETVHEHLAGVITVLSHCGFIDVYEAFFQIKPKSKISLTTSRRDSCTVGADHTHSLRELPPL